MNNNPDEVVQKLADAFESKNAEALHSLVSDPYSGLRFSSNWTDQSWKSFAQAFKTAKQKSVTEREATYEIEIIYPSEMNVRPDHKEIKLILNDHKEWVMVYSSFMITPHM